jgi:uncharacterized damage-inducible protein DinB
MQMLETIRQLYDYNTWANKEFMRYFQSAPHPDEKAVRVFAHLLLAEKVWLERIRGENSDNTGKDFWAGKTVANCAALFEENERKFAEFFGILSELKLGASFSYKNSQSAAFENIVREALTHVFFHSGYHRGQAAQTIRLSGDAPPSTDFIQFLRQ